MVHLPDVLLHSPLVVAIGWVALQASVRWLGLYVLNWTKRKLRKKREGPSSRARTFSPPATSCPRTASTPSSGTRGTSSGALPGVRGTRHPAGSVGEEHRGEQEAPAQRRGGVVRHQGADMGDQPAQAQQHCAAAPVPGEVPQDKLHTGAQLHGLALRDGCHSGCSQTCPQSRTVTANKLYFWRTSPWPSTCATRPRGSPTLRSGSRRNPLDLKLLPMGLPISDIALVTTGSTPRWRT